jgi:hypothetical protein
MGIGSFLIRTMGKNPARPDMRKKPPHTRQLNCHVCADVKRSCLLLRLKVHDQCATRCGLPSHLVGDDILEDQKAQEALEGRSDTMLASPDQKLRGVVYGRSLDFKPQPPSSDLLATPIRLTDVAYVQLPRKGRLHSLRLLLQAAGLISIPLTVRLRSQAIDMIDNLQTSLLGKGRGKRVGVTHPCQIIPACEFVMGLPEELDAERRLLLSLLSRCLADYRKRISANRERPFLYGKEASRYFFTGYKEHQLLGKITASAEHFQAVQKIYANYYFFRMHYIFSIFVREPAEMGGKLFSKFMRSSFFLATIQNDGTISPKPAYRQLPPKEHVVFLAKRDTALQRRLREDEALRHEMQSLLRYFRPLRS